MDVNDMFAALGMASLAPGGVMIELLRRERKARSAQQQVTIAKVDQAAEAAAEAAALARPVGNGFAADVIRRLSAVQSAGVRIEAEQARQAEISGRTVARLDSTMKRLADHIDTHLQRAEHVEGSG